MSTDKYVNFISSQVKRERTMGFRAFDTVNEQTISETVHADFVGFSKGEKPHPKVLKHHSEAEFINKVHRNDGHEVHSPVYDEGKEYHHIHNGEHKGSFSWSHQDDSVMSHKQIKKKLPHAPDHVVKAIRQDQEDS